MTIARLLQQSASSNTGTAFDLTVAQSDTLDSFFSFGDLIDQVDSGPGDNEDIKIVAVQQATYISTNYIFVLTNAGKLHRFTISVADNAPFSSVATLDISTHPAIVNSGDRALDFQLFNADVSGSPSPLRMGLAVLWKDWDGSGTDYNKILYFELSSPYSLSLKQNPEADEYYMHATYTKNATCFSYRNSGSYDSGFPFEIFIRDDTRDKVAKLSGKTEAVSGNSAVPNGDGLTFVHDSNQITPTGSSSIATWLSLQVQENEMSYVSYEYVSANSRYETLVRSTVLTTGWSVSGRGEGSSVTYSPPINGWDDREDLDSGNGIFAETDIYTYKGQLIGSHWAVGTTLYLALRDQTTIAKVTLSDADRAHTGTFDRVGEHYAVMEGLGSGEVEYTVSDMYVADDGQYIYWMNNNFDQGSAYARRLYKASLTTPFSLNNLTASAGADISGVTAYDVGASLTSVPFHFDPTETKLIMCEGEELGNQISLVSYDLDSRGDVANKTQTGFTTISLGGSTDYTYPKAMHVSRDGTRIFILYFVAESYPSHRIYSGIMSTPWDVDTLSTVTDATVSPLVTDVTNAASSWFKANGISFNPAGTKLYISGVYNDENVIAEWTLGTAWDITDETLVLKHNLTKNSFGPFSGIYMTPTGKHIYAGHTYSNTLVRWDMY